MNGAIKFIFQDEITEAEYDEAYIFLKKIIAIGSVISLITLVF